MGSLENRHRKLPIQDSTVLFLHFSHMNYHSYDMKRSIPTNSPWFSVIVPVYNEEQHLHQCVRSILAQDFRDFELLLVDDGSTDGSPAICQDYARLDPRVRYLPKENRGSYQSRIFGMERASGQYILNCDADDYFRGKDAFSILHQKLTAQPCDVLQFGNVLQYNHLRRTLHQIHREIVCDRAAFLADEYPKLLCSHWEQAHLTCYIWNKVFHRRLLQYLPSSETAERIFWGDDLILDLHLMEHCEALRMIPDRLYAYRQPPGGEKSFADATMRDVDAIKKYQLQFLERQGPRPDRARILEALCFEAADWFFTFVCSLLSEGREDSLRHLIPETLALPRFQVIRAYYLDRPKDDRLPVALLRQADPQAYTEAAARQLKTRRLPKKLKSVVKRIYSML